MERTQDRPERIDRVRRYKEENTLKNCQVCGCQRRREGLSRYCQTHADRVGDFGSPTFRPIDHLAGVAPLAKDLAGRIRAKRLPDLENKLLATLGRSLPKDTAYVYRNREIECGVKTAEKARVIVATATKNAGAELVLAYAILWALAQEIDKPLHSNRGEWSEYFRAHLGQDLATLADIGRSWFETQRTYRTDNCYWAGQEPPRHLVSEERVKIKKRQKIKGAVKRRAGRLLLDALAKALGPTHHWIRPLGCLLCELPKAAAAHSIF